MSLACGLARCATSPHAHTAVKAGRRDPAQQQRAPLSAQTGPDEARRYFAATARAPRTSR